MAFLGAAVFEYNHGGRRAAYLCCYMVQQDNPLVFVDHMNVVHLSRGPTMFQSFMGTYRTLCDPNGAWNFSFITGRGYVSFNWRGSQREPVTVYLQMLPGCYPLTLFGVHPNGQDRVHMKLIAIKAFVVRPQLWPAIAEGNEHDESDWALVEFLLEFHR